MAMWRPTTGAFAKSLAAFLLITLCLPDVAHAGRTQDALRHASGLELHIHQKSVSLFRPLVRIREMSVLNPADFADPVMMEIESARAVYRYAPLLRGEIRLAKLSVYVSEIVIVRHPSGEMNIDALRAGDGRAWPAPSPNLPLPESPLPPISIEAFDCTVDRIVFKDYANPKQAERVFEGPFRFGVRSIEDPAAVFGWIAHEAAQKAGLKGLRGFGAG